MTTCDTCGVELAVGDFPFCPHGRSTLTTVPDDIPGGQWFENGWAEPRKFYSHSAHRAALAEAGYEIRAKYAGPDDKHLTRWDSVNLDAARDLVSRNSEAAKQRNIERAVITVTEGDSFRMSDLDG